MHVVDWYIHHKEDKTRKLYSLTHLWCGLSDVRNHASSVNVRVTKLDEGLTESLIKERIV